MGTANSYWSFNGLVLLLTTIFVAFTGCASRPFASSAALRIDFDADRDFYENMPKGGDLHSHLSGAVPFDILLQIAADSHHPYDMVFASGRSVVCGFSESGRKKRWKEPAECEGTAGAVEDVPISQVLQDPALVTRVRNAFTVRPSDGDSEGNQFQKFNRVFQMLDALTDRPTIIPTLVQAAMQDAYVNHVSYLELKLNPIGRTEPQRDKAGEWLPDDAAEEWTIERLSAAIAKAIETKNSELKTRWVGAPHLPPSRKDTDAWPENWPDPVEVRLIVQGDRTRPLREGGATAIVPIACPTPPALECTNTRLRQGYYLVAASEWSHLYVSIDLVRLPEVNFVSSRPLAAVFQDLQNEFGPIPLTLHAGETNLRTRRQNIGQALVLGADRIGHGFNLQDSERATKNRFCNHAFPLEISLTSNHALGLVRSIEEHPFPEYFRGELCDAGTGHRPVVLSTDDAGIFETSLTDEFVLAATTSFLYSRNSGILERAELIRLARNSIIHGFMDPVSKGRILRRWEQQMEIFCGQYSC